MLTASRLYEAHRFPRWTRSSSHDEAARPCTEQPLGLVYDARQEVSGRTNIVDEAGGFTTPNAGIGWIAILHGRHIAIHFTLEQMRIIEFGFAPVPIINKTGVHHPCRDRFGPVELTNDVNYRRSIGCITISSNCRALHGTM